MKEVQIKGTTNLTKYIERIFFANKTMVLRFRNTGSPRLTTIYSNEGQKLILKTF